MIPTGSDDLQYCSKDFNLISSLMRTMYTC